MQVCFPYMRQWTDLKFVYHFPFPEHGSLTQVAGYISTIGLLVNSTISRGIEGHIPSSAWHLSQSITPGIWPVVPISALFHTGYTSRLPQSSDP